MKNYWFTFGIIITGLVWLYSPQIHAKEKTASSTVQEDYASWNDFVQLWQKRTNLLQSGDFLAGDDVLLEILNRKLGSTWPDLFSLAIAMRHESQINLKAGYAERARFYAQVAIALAPRDPENYWNKAKIVFAINWNEIPTLIYTIGRALQLHITDWYSSRIFLQNFYFWLIELLLVMSVLLLVIWFIRHGKALLHDINHLFPRNTPFIISNIFFFILCLFPFLLRIGLAWYLVFMTAIIWWSLSIKERIVSSLFAMSWIVIVFILPALYVPLSSLNADEFQQYQALHEPGPPHSNPYVAFEQSVKGKTSYNEKAYIKYFIAGIRAIHAQQLPGLSRAMANKQALQLLKYAAKQNAWSPELLNALGVAYLRMGQLEHAQESFQEAINKDAKNLPALFNLSRLYYTQAKPEQAAQYLKTANGIHSKLTGQLSRLTKQYSKDFGYISRPKKSFYKHDWHASKMERFRMADQTWSLFAVGNRFYFIGITPLVILLLWVFAVLIRKSNHATICHLCGEIVCQRCYPDLPKMKKCADCYNINIAKHVPTNTVRIDKEIQSHRYLIKYQRIMRYVNLIAAGGKLLIVGNLWGIVYLALFAFGIVMIMNSIALPPDLIALSGVFMPVRITVGVLSILISYVFSFVHHIEGY